MTESSSSSGPPARHVYALAALYFLSASLFALDPLMIDVWLGFDPQFDGPHTTIAAAFAAFAGLFGATALTIDEVGIYAGGET